MRHRSLLLPGRAKSAADDLSGRGERELRGELHDARILVGGEPRAHVFLEVGLERFATAEAGPQNDHRLHHLGPDGIGLAHYGGQRDRGMAREAGLDLSRADPVAPARDQIVVAADEAEVPLVVPDAQIAADQPVAAELRLRGGLVAPVAQEHHRIRASVGQASQLARWKLAPLPVDDRHRVPWNGGPGPTRAHRREHGAVSDHQVALRLTVELVDGEAERAAPPLDQILAEALTTRGEAAETHARFYRSGRAQQLQRGRRHEDVAHPMARHQPHRLGRVELPRPVRDHADAVMPGGHEDVEESADPRPVRRGPEAVPGLRKAVVRILDAGEMSEQRPVRMKRALGLAGGAAGVDDERRIVGQRVLGLEAVGCLRQQRVQIERSLRETIHAEDGLQLRESLAQARQLGELVAIGDDGARPAVLQAELEGLLAEEREEGHRDQPGLPGGHVGDGRLVPLRKQDGDPVALLQAPSDQHIRQAVGERGDRVEGELTRRARGVDLDQRPGAGIPVGDVGTDVEPLGDVPAKRDQLTSPRASRSGRRSPSEYRIRVARGRCYFETEKPESATALSRSAALTLLSSYLTTTWPFSRSAEADSTPFNCFSLASVFAGHFSHFQPLTLIVSVLAAASAEVLRLRLIATTNNVVFMGRLLRRGMPKPQLSLPG